MLAVSEDQVRSAIRLQFLCFCFTWSLEAAGCSLIWHVDLASSERFDGLLVLCVDEDAAVDGRCTACRTGKRYCFMRL